MHPELKRLLEEVVIEAINLKKYATKEELNNLNYDRLAGAFFNSCIYGQMIGDCYSPRAKELIKKCCKIKYKDTDWKSDDFEKIDDLQENNSYVSPIEKFLFIYKPTTSDKSNKINELIKFLKDEIQTLENYEKRFET